MPRGMALVLLLSSASCVDGDPVLDGGGAMADASAPDAGRRDAGPSDGGLFDGGAADAGDHDAGRPADAGPHDAGEGPWLPPVACGQTLGGPPLADNVIEAIPGYADEAAALDFSTVPQSIDIAGLSAFQKTIVNYMLGRATGDAVTDEDITAAGPLGAAVRAAFAHGGGTDLDFGFLRRGLSHSYLCSRPVPGSLSILVERYGDFTSWTPLVVDCAKPKDAPRIIYSAPDGRIHVSQTLTLDGDVRETEVIFTDLRSDAQVDFAAYTEDGALTDRGTFATATSSLTTASPYTCFACHTDFDTGRIDRLFPIGTGAGCN